MKAGLVSITHGYNVLDFVDLVDRDLKGSSVSEQEREYLNGNKDRWRSELINYKRKTEMQFSSSSQRTHKLHQLFVLKELTYEEYLDKINQEKVWRVNAARFLQQVETKLQRLRYSDV